MPHRLGWLGFWGLFDMSIGIIIEIYCHCFTLIQENKQVQLVLFLDLRLHYVPYPLPFLPPFHIP